MAGFQYRAAAVLADKFNTRIAGRLVGDRRRLFISVKIAVRHVGNMRARVFGPLTHRMWIIFGVLLDRRRSPPVGVPLSQYRVDRAALHLIIFSFNVFFLLVLWLFGVVRDSIALRLQFGDGSLHLGNRSTDIRELDDIGFWLLYQFTQ